MLRLSVFAFIFLTATKFGSEMTSASLASPSRPYNILMLLPVSSKSHRNVFMPLATALTQRGHKITMISNHPAADNNPNITYIDHGLPHLKEENLNLFEIRENPLVLMEAFSSAVPMIARDIYDIPVIWDLYENRNQFDLVIIDYSTNECMYPFVHGRSFIGVGAPGLEPMGSAIVGNIQNPAYVTSVVYPFSLPLSFLQRLANIVINIAFPVLWRYHTVVPSIQKEISKRFPELPPLLEFERNQTLVLLNSHFSLSTPLPVLPGQIEVGCMQCGPGKPLPAEIEAFVSGADAVIFFSLGSFARGNSMPEHYKELILSVFRKLPYKVLWKFESEQIDLPKNVMIKKWLPQQDILAHPNVKLFISHCGLLSTSETMYHGTPVLGLPVFADQPKNAQVLQDKGMAKMLVWEELTEEILMDTILELMTNSSYQEQISTVSAIFRDQLQTPVQRAVFWTEFAIRHQGAVNLSSPERDLSWVEVLNLDILLAVHISLYLIYRVLKWIVCICCSKKHLKRKSKRE